MLSCFLLNPIYNISARLDLLVQDLWTVLPLYWVKWASNYIHMYNNQFGWKDRLLPPPMFLYESYNMIKMTFHFRTKVLLPLGLYQSNTCMWTELVLPYLNLTLRFLDLSYQKCLASVTLSLQSIFEVGTDFCDRIESRSILWYDLRIGFMIDTITVYNNIVVIIILL